MKTKKFQAFISSGDKAENKINEALKTLELGNSKNVVLPKKAAGAKVAISDQ
jgi:ribosomal protein S20